jgi:hypothetical protein
MSSYEEWPTETTTVVRPSPVEPVEPFSPAPGRGPDDGIGWGFLIGIVLALVAGGIVAAVLPARHHNRATTTPTTTAAAPTTTAAAPTTTAATTTTPASDIPPWPTAVPDVGSFRVQPAVDRLRSSGLLVTLAYVPDDQPLGTVVDQSPSGGTSAAAESHVTLDLSEGKGGAASKSVPSVTGRTIPEALSAVKAAGLRLIFARAPVSDRSQAGTVVEQTPAPGTRIPARGEVLVFMGAAR